VERNRVYIAIIFQNLDTFNSNSAFMYCDCNYIHYCAAVIRMFNSYRFFFTRVTI